MKNELNYMTPWTEVINWTPEAALMQASNTKYGSGIFNPNGQINDFDWEDEE